jgi:hypothetical protein
MDQTQSFFRTLGEFTTLLAVKLYRLQIELPAPVPRLPCLDHEAMLHGGIPPHVAAYVEDATGNLHEVVYLPGRRRIDVEVVSTMGECTAEAHERFVAALGQRFPGVRVRVLRPSWLKGDVRVADSCRAQVTLRDVLLGADLDRTKAAVDRLHIISSLMEKESRVASWGARTVMASFLAVAGFLTYQILGSMGPRLGGESVDAIRLVVVTLVGGFFLYYGMKAVHLTVMSTRAWKRAAEYTLILDERRRLGGTGNLQNRRPGE